MITGIGTSDAAQLAMLLTQADEKDRDLARAAAQSADQGALQEGNERVDDLRAKAGSDEEAAWIGGASDIAGGVGTVIGAWGGGNGQASCPAGPGDAATPAAAAPPIPWAKIVSGMGKAAADAGGSFAGLARSAGEVHDAQAAKDEALATAFTHQYDEARSDAQAADDSVQKVQQFLQATLQAEDAARLAAIGGRA